MLIKTITIKNPENNLNFGMSMKNVFLKKHVTVHRAHVFLCVIVFDNICLEMWKNLLLLISVTENQTIILKFLFSIFLFINFKDQKLNTLVFPYNPSDSHSPKIKLLSIFFQFL